MSDAKTLGAIEPDSVHGRQKPIPVTLVGTGSSANTFVHGSSGEIGVRIIAREISGSVMAAGTAGATPKSVHVNRLLAPSLGSPY